MWSSSFRGWGGWRRGLAELVLSGKPAICCKLIIYLRMISAHNASTFVARKDRCPPRIKCGAGLFRIMRDSREDV
jgi:hypothetical protein